MIMDKGTRQESFAQELAAACKTAFERADAAALRLDGDDCPDCSHLFQPDEFSFAKVRQGFSSTPSQKAPPKSSSPIFRPDNLFTLVDGEGRSLFHLAAREDRPQMLLLLLRTAHSLALASPLADGVMAAAAKVGHAQCINMLLSDSWGETTDLSSRRAPLPRALSIDLPGPEGKTALAVAAERGSVQCCQVLLEFNASPSSRDSFGWTPYMRAIEAGHLRVMDILAEADPECQDRRSYAGETPAMIACASNQPSALSILCSTPENMALRARETRDDGSTALMMAAGGDSLSCAKIILDASEVDAQNTRGATALSAASHAMSIDVIKLLAPISNPALADADAMTPLIYAIIQQPDSPRRAEAISILADSQDPSSAFVPSTAFQARFGDQVARSFDAMQWAEFISSRGSFDADREIADILARKAQLWRDGLLFSSRPSPMESRPESGDGLPDRLMDAAKLARRRLDRASAIVDAPMSARAP